MTRPNILLITADQMRGDCLGAVGHPVIKTPNLDGLADAGVCFTQHYAQALPCSPSRASLYTGQYQMTHRVVQNGTPLDQRHDNLALMFRRAGYGPTLFGYTDQTIDPRTTTPDDPALTNYENILPGFDAGVHMPSGNEPWRTWMEERGHRQAGHASDLYCPPDQISDRPTRNPAGFGADESPAAFLTSEFLGWLKAQKPDQPWCAHVSFLQPHPPFHTPEPYNLLYDPDEGPAFARAENVEAELLQHPLLAHRINSHEAWHFLIGAKGIVKDWTDLDYRILRATYWGMVSEIDAQAGRIIDWLKADGGWDNTLIVFTSDHGEMMGDHWTLGKFGYFDQSYHVPLIVRDPARPKSHGQRFDAFSESIDVLPTLLDMSGIALPNTLAGRSLVPFLDNQTPANWREAVHWEFDFRDLPDLSRPGHFGLSIDDSNMAVMRTKTHKYVHFSGLPALLFDLRDDPSELINLADDPAYGPIRLHMAEALLAWRARFLDRQLTGLVATESGMADFRNEERSSRIA